MKPEEKLICEYMYEFANKHWDKIDRDKCSLTDTKNKFLTYVANDLYTAMWMLEEVCVWAMDKTYLKELYVETFEHYDFSILKINDKYIKVQSKFPHTEYKVEFVEPKFKQVIYFD
jgi:hypothetical protein